MKTISEEAHSQRRSRAARLPKRTRPAHQAGVISVRWCVPSHAGMCGTTRRAMRRSKVDSSDELDFVASAYCSLCISKTPAPLIRESTGTDARLKPRVRRATVFQKTALSGDCRHVVVQEKNFS